MEYLAITSFEIGRGHGIDGIENFFLQIGAEIKKKKTNSLRAFVEHPDGLDVHIKVKCYEFEKKYMEVNRRSGDPILFHLLYKMIFAYHVNGDAPNLYPGQLCPRLQTTPQEDPSTLPPDFCLDLNVKRKRE